MHVHDPRPSRLRQPGCEPKWGWAFLQLKSSGKHFSKSPKGVEFAVEGTRPAIAATIPSLIRGGFAGSVLAMHRLLLYALAAMNGGPFSSDPVVQEDYISPLPGALRRSLMAVHASGRSKHSAVPWRPEMDAFVLGCATFETASRCQRWQSSGRLNPPCVSSCHR